MRILLIEDNDDEAQLVREMLARAGKETFELERASRLAEGLERLAEDRFDTVLLDLSLPDSQGIETFLRTCEHAPGVPIIVLSGLQDEELAAQAMRQGAQDYLVKGDINGRALVRVLRYAVQRKRAEEAVRFQAKLLECVRESVIATDLEGRVTYWGKGAEALYGYTSDEVMGRQITFIVEPEEREDELQRMRRVIEHGSWSGQYVQRRRDGTAFWADTVISLVTDGRGVPRGFIGIDRDITERKEFEEALQCAKDAADVANIAKTSFLANMSHEIRTPMNAIVGYTDLLKERLREDEDAVESLSAIEHGAAHLLALVNDILDLSKIEAEKLEIERVRCSISKIIEEVNSVVRMAAVEKGIAVTWRCASSVPEHFLSDPTRIRQALINLLANAVKFSERGRIAVTLRYEPETRRLEFAVEDTGIGIPAAQLEQIFEPFFRVEEGATRRRAGTGLGLSISKRLAELLGGDLRVESDLGVGSIFTFAIRAEGAEGTAAIGPAEESVEENRAAAKPREVRLAGRVLVVDDVPENRSLLQAELERAGATVEAASDALSIVDACRAGGFDAVLLDICMPVVDGFQALRALRANGIETPCAAVTAQAMKGDEERCLSAGFDAYLAKPFKRAELLEIVSELLSQTEPASEEEKG